MAAIHDIGESLISSWITPLSAAPQSVLAGGDLIRVASAAACAFRVIASASRRHFVSFSRQGCGAH
jgi:hypothetical protein